MTKKIEPNESLQSLISTTIKEVAEKAYKLGYSQGLNDGLEIGIMTGFKEGIDSMKSAVSEGTRCGSSECGKKLQEYRNADSTIPVKIIDN